MIMMALSASSMLIGTGCSPRRRSTRSSICRSIRPHHRAPSPHGSSAAAASSTSAASCRPRILPTGSWHLAGGQRRHWGRGPSRVQGNCLHSPRFLPARCVGHPVPSNARLRSRTVSHPRLHVLASAVGGGAMVTAPRRRPGHSLAGVSTSARRADVRGVHAGHVRSGSSLQNVVVPGDRRVGGLALGPVSARPELSWTTPGLVVSSSTPRRVRIGLDRGSLRRRLVGGQARYRSSRRRYAILRRARRVGGRWRADACPRRRAGPSSACRMDEPLPRGALRQLVPRHPEPHSAGPTRRFSRPAPRHLVPRGSAGPCSPTAGLHRPDPISGNQHKPGAASSRGAPRLVVHPAQRRAPCRPPGVRRPRRSAPRGPPDGRS